MKKVIVMLMVGLLMASCATLTPEEKAAREAAIKESIKTTLQSKNYKINVNSVTPMRAGSRTISGSWIKMDSTIVECWLPYAGLDDIPHLKTRGEFRLSSKIELKSEMRNYLLAINPTEERVIISFNADNHGLDCKFKIVIENTGKAYIHVEPEKRDYIDYEGYLVLKKK